MDSVPSQSNAHTSEPQKSEPRASDAVAPPNPHAHTPTRSHAHSLPRIIAPSPAARFTQADTLIPSPASPQAFNRYAYTLNNPLRFTDPSGHCIPGWNCPGDQPDDGAPPSPPPPPPPPWKPQPPPPSPPKPIPQPVPTPPQKTKGTPTPQLQNQNRYMDSVPANWGPILPDWLGANLSLPHPFLDVDIYRSGLFELAFSWDINMGTNTDAGIEITSGPGVNILPSVNIENDQLQISTTIPL